MSGNQQKNGRKRRFSFIGLLVALVILSGTWQPQINIELVRGKQQVTKIEIKELEGALQLFYFDVGRYPTSSEGLEAIVYKPRNLDSWKGPYVTKDLPKDPWRKPYIYRCPGRHGNYDLLSCGPDGVEGNADDIVSWR